MNDGSWPTWAEECLRANWRNAVESACQRPESAHWHPNGFIVFRLGEVESGRFRGSHRVHIWPGAIARRSMLGHPTIHSHDWELESLVLSGRYADVIFEPSTQAPPLLAHAVLYGEEGRDSITPTGSSVHLAQREVRVVDRGACHHMDIGVAHETLVPDDETVVTYVMMGPRQEHGMLLAGVTPFTAVAFKRPSLTEGEQRYASRTLRTVLLGEISGLAPAK